MRTILNSIELEDNSGNVFATFKTEEEYQIYLMDLAVEMNDLDCDQTDLFDFVTWYCIFENNNIVSINEKKYLAKKGNLNVKSIR